MFDPSLSTYTPAGLPIVSIVIGSFMFGIDIAVLIDGSSRDIMRLNWTRVVQGRR